ncbi:generative cell specific-1 [Trypanosoma rangeli]|uniref:Generative cell specific-1 n=1 Tax=Trypanosoma rangeli TaxID=5698 RepID=A0A3R7NLN3_TRYRA|nr:generative cell specific-1 [Trypanosoma rangeli]RNF04482.1 generative cell specific-1 [Trypanosoma rangeli]|eukprot:RNF04482.1 generative cell specific-1 [Trypanosoma rangeli]
MFPLLVVFALIVPFRPFDAEGALLASSSIEYCERGSTTDLLPCEKKMVVTLSVDNAQDAGVEEFVLLQDAVDKTRGTGEEPVKFEPIRLTTKKSRVQHIYPLFYEQNFNSKPYEEQIPAEIIGCEDGSNSKATCGVVLDAAGETIPYSEGFCCRCGMCQLLGICPPDSRGLQVCNVFGEASMASCLRFGELWYSGYSIGSASTWYRLEVKLTANSSTEATKARQAVFELGPDVLSGSSPEFGAWVNIVGDFVPSEAPLVLTEKMLFVPTLPRKHKLVLAGSSEWLLLDKHRVSIQGRECDKVGVSYEAFASQGSRCQLRRGSCLADQLEDYRLSDIAVEAKGGRGQYMARFFGDFVLGNANATDGPTLSYWMQNSLTTMVTIVISADRLKYVLSVSPGEIIATEVSKSVIESASRDGVLVVTVRNTGSITAQYTLGVGNCSRHVHPMMAQAVSMAPHQTLTRVFDLNVQGTLEKGLVHCDVTLQDARGGVTDKKLVEFRVTSVEWKNGTQGGNAPSGNGGSVGGNNGSACKRCEWYNIVCFLMHRCWWQPLLYVLVVIAVLLGVYFFCKMFSCINDEHKDREWPI